MLSATDQVEFRRPIQRIDTAGWLMRVHASASRPRIDICSASNHAYQMIVTLPNLQGIEPMQVGSGPGVRRERARQYLRIVTVWPRAVPYIALLLRVEYLVSENSL